MKNTNSKYKRLQAHDWYVYQQEYAEKINIKKFRVSDNYNILLYCETQDNTTNEAVTIKHWCSDFEKDLFVNLPLVASVLCSWKDYRKYDDSGAYYLIPFGKHINWSKEKQHYLHDIYPMLKKMSPDELRRRPGYFFGAI